MGVNAIRISFHGGLPFLAEASSLEVLPGAVMIVTEWLITPASIQLRHPGYQVCEGYAEAGFLSRRGAAGVEKSSLLMTGLRYEAQRNQKDGVVRISELLSGA